MNAADDGLAGIQQLAGDATLLYYMTEEAQEGKNAYLEKRSPTSTSSRSARDRARRTVSRGAGSRTTFGSPRASSRSRRRRLTPGERRLWVQGRGRRRWGRRSRRCSSGPRRGAIDGRRSGGGRGCALVVALALQVGVNYANDYSDGVRGTDANRRGPVRLIATGLATPAAVRNAATLAFAVAAVVGGVLSLVVNPWLLLVGVAVDRGRRDLHRRARSRTATSASARSWCSCFFGFVATVGIGVRAARAHSRRRRGGARSRSVFPRARSCSRTTCATSRPTRRGQAHARGAHRRARGRGGLFVGVPRRRAARHGRARRSRTPGRSLALAGGAASPGSGRRSSAHRSDPPSLVAALIGTVGSNSCSARCSPSASSCRR